MKVIEFCSKYKYILTVIAFAAYLVFGENNLLENHKLNFEIRALNSELQKYKETIDDMKRQNAVSFYTTLEEQEEYFRRQYHYKKENEDVFRLVSSPK